MFTVRDLTEARDYIAATATAYQDHCRHRPSLRNKYTATGAEWQQREEELWAAYGSAVEAARRVEAALAEQADQARRAEQVESCPGQL